jgi:hypothetical protein
MTRQYSAKTFLRNTPNDILRQYFEQRQIDLKLEWVRLHETEVNPIFLALEELPERTRSEVDSDFRIINELACDDGVQAILEEAAFWGRDWAEQFASMRNHYERAFWTFLNEPRRFHVAGCFHEMDRLGGWRRRFVGRRLEAQDDEDALAELERRVRLFYRRQGRGRFCHVDYYERRDPERHCYFAYPEDYASTDVGYDENGHFLHRPRRSAFEVIFVYRPEEGVLELHAKGNKRQNAELAEIFCTTILGLVELPDENDRVPFDLTALKNPDFPFTTDPADRIAAVHVRQLRFDLPEPTRGRLTVSAHASDHRPRALRDLVDRAIDRAQMPLDALHVSQAKLRLVFAPRNGERPKTLTFEVTYPDRCTLKDDPHDQIAKKCLRQWGIARD